MTIRQITNAVPILLIRFYQVALSPLFPPTCRFDPSCSRYGLEAFRTHHFFKAFGLTVWRVVRCNPFVKGGYDPVPSVDASPVLSSDASNPPHTCQAHKH